MICQIAAAASLAGLLSVPTMALAGAADSAGVVTTITGLGEGGWEMICHITPTSGEEMTRVLDKSRGTFTGEGIRRASCDFNNRSRTPLVISISAPEAKCPFKSADPEQCTQPSHRVFRDRSSCA